jgi:hypothetical protein
VATAVKTGPDALKDFVVTSRLTLRFDYSGTIVDIGPRSAVATTSVKVYQAAGAWNDKHLPKIFLRRLPESNAMIEKEGAFFGEEKSPSAAKQAFYVLSSLLSAENIARIERVDHGFVFDMGSLLERKVTSSATVPGGAGSSSKSEPPQASQDELIPGLRTFASPESDASEIIYFRGTEIIQCLASAGGHACIDRHVLAEAPLIPGFGVIEVNKQKLKECIEENKRVNFRQDQSSCLEKAKL